MTFSPQQIIDFLPDSNRDYLVAYSGGLDSHVLLHAMWQLRGSAELDIKLQAIHINHGISPNSAAWAEHCRRTCSSYNIPLDVFEVSVEKSGAGLESAARDARLSVFSEKLQPGQILLAAHHLDDQMETMLFRMLRGTGLRGLSGIALNRELGQGQIVRPLLGTPRSELVQYAALHKLEWIEDESNAVTDFDRNYLRHQVIPLLSARWPGFRKNWQRLAQLTDEGELLQRELGMQDLEKVRDGLHRLDIKKLQEFSPIRQRNIVRSWFISLEQEHAIAAPDYNVVQRIFDELIPASVDASPLVSWEKSGQRVEIRRFASRVYLVLPRQSLTTSEMLLWDTSRPLQLPGQLGTLALVENDEEGVVINPGEVLEVGFRQGGETVKPAGRKTRTLKKTLPDYDVPPWLRETTPLIFREGELLAVADLFLSDQQVSKKNEAEGKKRFKFEWLRSDLHCGY